MATSGSFTTGETSGRSLTVNWWRNSVSGNTSNIGWNVVGSGSLGGGGWVTCGNMYLEMNGTVVLSDSTRIDVYNGTVYYSGSINMTHDANGAKSFWLSFAAGIYYVAQNAYASGTPTIDRIPLAPTGITVGHDSVTSSSVRVNTEITSFGHGTAAACRIYYRTYPSGGWVQTADQSDAAGPNYFTISGLSPYQTYEYKAYWWNNNGDNNYSSTGSFTTLGYANYTNNSPYCETIKSNALNIAVCVDTTCDSLAVSTNGGAWTYYNGDFSGWKVVTIGGLSPGTQYSFKTSVKRKDSQLWKESGTFYGTTLAHSAITSATGSINDTASSVSISFTNPTGTPVNVYLELPNIAGAPTYKNTTNATSPTTLTLDTATKNAILSAMTGVKSTKLRYVVHDALDGVNTYTLIDSTITIIDANPVFTNFTYLDYDDNIPSVTQNDQYLVQNYSSLRAVISSANKAVAQKGATITRYTFNINGYNDEQPYSTFIINKNLGIVTAATDQVLTIEAIDSRGNKTAVTKTVKMIPYSVPVIVASATRLNDFEEDTTLEVDGTFSRVSILGTDKNTVDQDNVSYRYKPDNGAYSEWIPMTRELAVGEFTTTNEYFTLDNTLSYTFQIKVDDLIDSNTVTVHVDRGKPIFMISSNLNSVGVGQVPTEEDVLEVADDMLIKASMEARDHYDGSDPRVVNVCYGTSATPPSATTTPGGTIYIQYTD